MSDQTKGNVLTLEQFREALPKSSKFMANMILVDEVNRIISGDEDIKEIFKENMITFVSVMRDGRFKTEQYLAAVKYVSYKMMGSTNALAYNKTFPERLQRYIDKTGSTVSRELSAAVFAYNASKLVNLIYAQSLVPMHVLNVGLYQEALNMQAQLMHTAKSEKVRCDAANSIMQQLKSPETQKIELDIGIKEDKTIEELKESTMRLVAQQKVLMNAGMATAKDTAHSKLTFKDENDDFIEGEIVA